MGEPAQHLDPIDPVWEAMQTSAAPGDPLTDEDVERLAEADEDVRAGRIYANHDALRAIEARRPR